MTTGKTLALTSWNESQNNQICLKMSSCDEMWIFQYDPEMKSQLMHWKTPTLPGMKKARISTSKAKAMMIIFFNIRGIIMTEWVPEGSNGKSKVLPGRPDQAPRMSEAEKAELWKKKSWILHQDNVPAHNTLAVKQILADKCIPVLEHPPTPPIHQI
jgi:hypothetical protein